jgi:4-diphosphocytidyl-2-C-methyl-D-erythritol kinase
VGLNVSSYAKVNLFLRVLGRRQDGYHDVETIVQTISLHDLLTFDLAESGIEVAVSGPAAEGVPGGEDNLCHKAIVHLLTQSTNVPRGTFETLELDNRGSQTPSIVDVRPGIRVRLRKMVPAGAGLGGGSGNAACTLMALNQMFSFGLSVEELCTIGAKVGSDVPALVLGGTVLAEGRGERVQRCEGVPLLHFLVVKPDFGCRTEEVYRLWDEAGHTGSGKASEALEAFSGRNFAALRQMELNDLESPAFSVYPELAELKAALLDGGAEVAFLCGSGSGVAGVYGSQEERDAAWFELRRPGWQVFHAESVGQGGLIDAQAR